ncbi:MAG: NnrU family protein [Alphaproteobacteria bacterium]
MTGSFAALVAAALLFTGGHFMLSGASLRRFLIGRLGRLPYLVLYSVIAVATLAWLILAFARAPYVELWGDPLWARYLVLVLMPFAAILLMCGALTPSPTAIGGARVLRRDDPAPGILKVTRHPVMWAFALWAAVHLIANGDMASLILFGAVLTLALGGMAHMEARRRAEGGRAWQRLAAATSVIPFAAAYSGRARISLAGIGWGRMVLGVALYLVLLLGHEWVLDASPWPAGS